MNTATVFSCTAMAYLFADWSTSGAARVSLANASAASSTAAWDEIGSVNSVRLRLRMDPEEAAIAPIPGKTDFVCWPDYPSKPLVRDSSFSF